VANTIRVLPGRTAAKSTILHNTDVITTPNRYLILFYF
jgi:hypothetical protein